MHFRIRALDEVTQRVVSTSLEAADEADALQRLRERRLTPISTCLAHASGPGLRAGWLGVALRGRTPSFPVELLAQELHALVSAGLSLTESLEAIADKEQQAERSAVLARLLTSLREGRRFSVALRAQGQLFPALFIGVVEAAENTGELAGALERYIAYAQRLQAVRQKMISAAIYPAVLLSVGSLVALFLIGWVVPRFAAAYRGGGRSLPWGSQLLLQWGEFASRNALSLTACLGLLLLGATLWVGSMKRRGVWPRLVGLAPGMARWLELLTLSRLYLTLGLLLQGGLPIRPALALARSVLPGSRAPSVDEVSVRLGEGWSVSSAMQAAGLTTPIALRFLRAGERSGQLPQMLHRAANYHEAETARWMERFSRAFEPMLMTAIGLVIGLIVLLLYMPIFELAGSLQ